MTDMTQIARQFRELVRVAMAMPPNSVRPANQNAPTDDLDQFATVHLAVVTPTGLDDGRLVNEAAPSLRVNESQVGQRQVLASINFYKGDGPAKAARLWQALNLSPHLERLQIIGLGLIRAGPAKDLTVLNGPQWEPRGQVDIEFHVIAKEAISSPTFGRFPVEVETETVTENREVFES